MSIKVNIFYHQLRQLINNLGSVKVDGSTVDECLKDLVKQFHGTEKLIFDEHGQLLRHVYVYLNQESIHKTGLAAPVKDGDTLIIAVSIIGG